MACRRGAGAGAARPGPDGTGPSAAVLHRVERSRPARAAGAASVGGRQSGRGAAGAPLPCQRPCAAGLPGPPVCPARRARPADPRVRPARPWPGRRGVRGSAHRASCVRRGARVGHRRRDLRPAGRRVRHPGGHGEVAVRGDGSGQRGHRLGRLHHPGRPRSGRGDGDAGRGGGGAADPFHRGSRGRRTARAGGVLPQLRLGGLRARGLRSRRHGPGGAGLPRDAGRRRGRSAHPGARLGGQGRHRLDRRRPARPGGGPRARCRPGRRGVRGAPGARRGRRGPHRVLRPRHGLARRVHRHRPGVAR